MSLFKKGTHINDAKLSSPSKATTLNPNAAEFIPFALRSSSSGNKSTADATSRLATLGTLGKAVLDRSESSVSNNSDEEAHQYWRCQLPDDITPDFKVMGQDDSQGIGNLSLAGLSLHDDSDASRFPVYEQQELSSQSTNEMPPYDGNSRHRSMNDMLVEQAMVKDNDTNPVEFLASHFPGFAAESLAEVYLANGCDLNQTIEMLTRLELQVDGGFSENMNAKTLDFPALTVLNSLNGPPKYAGDDLQQSGYLFRSDKDSMLLFKSGSCIPSQGAIDFASAVRKLASQDSGIWKYDRNGSADDSIGSSRSSHVLNSAYNSGNGRSMYGGKLQNRGSTQMAPVWLETGDAVANMYSDLREEARDHARLRNAYFEQARYIIGNKALAKELSAKGQVHNMQMKAAHGEAHESIYRQRFVVPPATFA
ncbi:hypothetical protein I3760_15G084600 [Carya illinoinensis]|nr:hypothetical protein I3760_15G084600 [Carya illinoinensis]